MNVIWYLPTKHELVQGTVFGGKLEIDWHRRNPMRCFATVRDSRRYYNVVRVEFDYGMPQAEKEVLMNNVLLIAEMKLDAIRNGHEPAIQNATDDRLRDALRLERVHAA